MDLWSEYGYKHDDICRNDLSRNGGFPVTSRLKICTNLSSVFSGSSKDRSFNDRSNHTHCLGGLSIGLVTRSIITIGLD